MQGRRRRQAGGVNSALTDLDQWPALLCRRLEYLEYFENLEVVEVVTLFLKAVLADCTEEGR